MYQPLQPYWDRGKSVSALNPTVLLYILPMSESVCNCILTYMGAIGIHVLTTMYVIANGPGNIIYLYFVFVLFFFLSRPFNVFVFVEISAARVRHGLT